MNRKTILMAGLLLLLAVSAFAQEAAVTTTAPATAGVRWNLVSACFLLAVAAAAGAMGQSRAIAAACEGIARNPTAAGAIRTAMLIGLALIESLVIYALVIAFMAMRS